MCGRYATTRSSAQLSAAFEATDETDGGLRVDYNVAPTDAVAIVRADPAGAGRELRLARWGLVPHWAADARGAARMINARAETVVTSRAYGPSFARRRCLVPADGWYEWVRGPGGAKQAFYLTPADGAGLAFAGIWSLWHNGGQPLLSCSVITVPALGELARVHSRMPLLLDPDRWPSWLAPGGDPAALLAPPPIGTLADIELRPVGPAVGDVRNDGPGLVARVPAPAVEALPAEGHESTLF